VNHFGMETRSPFFQTRFFERPSVHGCFPFVFVILFDPNVGVCE